MALAAARGRIPPRSLYLSVLDLTSNATLIC